MRKRTILSSETRERVTTTRKFLGIHDRITNMEERIEEIHEVLERLIKLEIELRDNLLKSIKK